MNLTVGTNSWISVADADTYFKTRLFANRLWNDQLTQPDKEAALITAFNQIFGCGQFDLSLDDESSTIRQAQCEMALFLLQHLADSDSRMGLQAQGVTQAGIVQETYDTNKAGVMPIPANVMALLKDSRTGDVGFASGDISRDDEE